MLPEYFKCTQTSRDSLVFFPLCFTLFYVDFQFFIKLACPLSNRSLQSHMNVQYKPQVTYINSAFMYLLTPWSGVLQLVKKFPAFYGTRKSIQKYPPPFLILSQLDPIHSPTFHLLMIHLNIILQSTPGSSKWSLSLRFPHQKPEYASRFPIRATCLVNLILLDFIP